MIEALPGSRTIPLTRGMYAFVDECDYDQLAKFRWHASERHGIFYARRQLTVAPGKQKTELMHRVIMGDARLVDHRNGNGLDNRRSNLRIVNYQQNGRNRKINKNSSSGFMGVKQAARTGAWIAQITFNRKCLYLGTFNSPLEAALARDLKALDLDPDHYSLNFPYLRKPLLVLNHLNSALV